MSDKSLLDDLKEIAFTWKVNNELTLYLSTGDARFFWRAFLLLHKDGRPIPQNFMDKFAQIGERILQTTDVTALPAALELAGSAKDHIGPKQSAAYRARRRLASEVAMVRSGYKISLSEAIRIVARNKKMSVAKVKKAYHDIFTAPLSTDNKSTEGDSLTQLAALWR